MSNVNIHFDLRLLALWQFLMIVLKVTTFPTMSYGWVFMPMWLPFLVILIITLIGVNR